MCVTIHTASQIKLVKKLQHSALLICKFYAQMVAVGSIFKLAPTKMKWKTNKNMIMMRVVMMKTMKTTTSLNSGETVNKSRMLSQMGTKLSSKIVWIVNPASYNFGLMTKRPYL